MPAQGQLITAEQEALTIQPDEHLAIAPQPITNPLQILSLAVEKGACIETIERLVALHNQMEEREAKASFDEAMNAAQKEMEPVRTNADNPQTHSRYATYKAIDKAIRPIYTKHGFSLSFNTEDFGDGNVVKIVCYVARGKYERKYQLVMPSDGKGAKGGDVMTKTHATGAALTYGKRYLLCDIFNIVIGDDKDGNAGSFDELSERIEWIQNASTMDELKQIFKRAYEAAAAVKDQQAMDALIRAKDARKKEIGQ
jgi:ERF superfamily